MFRKFLYFGFLAGNVLFTNSLTAQEGPTLIIPNTSGVPAATQTVRTVPNPYYTGSAINLIKVWEPQAPFVNDSDVVSASRTAAQVRKVTQYFDGLGRPIQTVSWRSSPNQKDLVSMHHYDEFGREPYAYLPYVQTASGTNTNDGKFKADPFANQATFMAGQFSGEAVFYNQTVLENSSLGRPLKSMAAGNSWAGSNRGIAMGYEINAASEVRIWTIASTIGSFPASTAFYGAGELIRSISTDEHGKRVVEYKDKNGQVVLKKVEKTTGATITSHTGWLCTYYVYDNFGLLRFVLSPKAVEALSSWTVTSTIANELCFRYEYDSRKRMIIKKVPGSGEVHMVYDLRDRLVMTQDANLRNNDQWMVMQYDNLNRPVKTFLLTNGDDRVTHEGDALNELLYPNTSMLSAGQLLTENFYDDYNWATGISGISSSLDNSFTGSPDYIGSFNTSPYYAQQLVKSNATRGMVTGTKVHILGTNNFTYNLTLYDDKGRPIQVQSTNHTGGTDIVSTQYDFAGKALRTHNKHIRASGITPLQTGTILTYDHAGRLIEIQKRINDQEPVLTTSNIYDDLGQLAIKQLGFNNITNEFLEILDYTYNIRGWLTGINKDYANSTDEDDLSKRFGMELSYNHGFTESQFNGNIAGIKWKSTGCDKQRAYGFAYDNANRLLKGDFTQYTSTWNTTAGVDYSMKMGNGIHGDSAYDANGNILKMWQKGLKLTTSSVIDDLNYSYTANTNKLLSVTEQSLGTTDNHLGDFTDKNTSNDDYTYDVNGNLITDKNKAITAINYNHLNLPQNITITGKGTITYTYDAAGTKLKKVTVDTTINPSKTTTTYYVAGFVYEQINTDTIALQFFAHEEGRIRKRIPITPEEIELAAGNNFDFYWFDYFIKDHLGNVRMVLTDEQKTDIYFAGSESAQQEAEAQLFVNYENIVEKPGCFDDNEENQFVQVVGVSEAANQQVVGVGKVLKVMAGDKVNAQVFGWYSPSIANAGSPTSLTPIEDVLLSLFGTGLTNTIGSKGATPIVANDLLSTGIGDFLNTQNNYLSGDGAYLNWIFLDEEQLKLVESSSGFVSLFQTATETGCGDYKTLLQINAGEGVEIKKNGYLYIYVSNTSEDYPVYFDDIHIEHIRGSLIEETHYYPFGLTMSGISSKAATNAPANRYKYNGKEEQKEEFSDGSGLEWTDYGARMYDGQIGRFFTQDRFSEKYFSFNPYHYTLNNPIIFIDVNGDSTIYYSAEGAELYRTTDKSANAITVIPNKHLGGFSAMYNLLNELGVDLNGAIATFIMRAYGETYDINGVFSFLDGNAKNYNKQTDVFQPNDGKGPLINEQSARVEKKNGVWTVNPDKKDNGPTNPFSVTLQGPGPVTMHTHESAGRKVIIAGEKATVPEGKESVGNDGDIPNARNRPGSGLLQMAVTKNSIFFYNTSGVVITIDRNAFNSKKTKK